MKAIVILLLSFITLSCSIERVPDQRTVYLVTVADDFYNFNGNGRKLENVVTDSAAINMQLETLGEVHTMCFISEEGKRYTSSNPTFVPKDKNGNELSDPSSPLFRRFSYKPKEGEDESGWTVRDVMEYLGKIEADEDDIIIFTYSGHGEKKSGALMMNASFSSYEWDSISPEDFLDTITSLGGKKLVVLDSCYSGQYIPDSELISADKFASGDKEDRWIGFDYPGAALSTYTKGKKTERIKDLWIISASGKGQEASDNLSAGDGPFQEFYGAFTYYFLKALGYDTDRNLPSGRDKRLTVFQIYSEIRSAFPDYETQIQTPRTYLKGLDLILR